MEQEAAKEIRRRTNEGEQEGEGKWLSSNLSLIFAEVSLLLICIRWKVFWLLQKHSFKTAYTEVR